MKNCWVLAFCGVLHAIVTAIYLLLQRQNGPLTMYSSKVAVLLLSGFLIAAGVCVIMSGVWSSRNGESWMLVVNGLACSTLGLIYTFGTTRGLAFRTIAELIVVMAISMAIYEFAVATRLGRAGKREWIITVAAVGSMGFALFFLAFVLGGIKLDPGSAAESLLWMSSYFGFSAISIFWLALRACMPSVVPSARY
jgi:uncharacterized membrane protein HdeD (DUF308 family)